MYLPQRGALNNFKNHTEVFGSIHCFPCDFLALHQYHIICRLQYFASHTLKHHLQPINELATREAVLNHVLFLLTPCTFLYSFCHKNPCIDWQYDQSPTCPKPEPRVATRPLPRPLYFWYLLVQFETYIVVTVYCPCESIKHQVVETCFCWNPINRIQSSDGGSNTIVLEHRATNSSIGQRFGA